MENPKGIKLKLCFHQKHHYKEVELLVNVRDLGPNVKEGDILEIYHPEEDEHQARLLLQIPHYEEENIVTKDTISVEQNIASSFQLRSYKDVIVSKVDPKSVALELLELTFKDQYLGRSDMWRLKMSLVNTVTYCNKKIEFCNNSIRCQTYEMWAHGEKVACGVITEDTKVVFRSSTCQAYLFIQMSSEMWEFDMYGDLYFEKAVSGFLAELFAKWKKEMTNHDVTIVLFSRTYYKASSLEDFPQFMRECLLQDYQGRFYEDFYRVAVQSERFDDWMPILSHLRQLFHSYLEDVLEYHSSPDFHIPDAYNSNAPQGNFLEVLNISLNVFEKHYLDRSFERTGQMSVVITPGVGVFEVDRELTNITKQRIVDNGVGSDLVCLGEQPLHAVPLLKFHKKRGSFADDYSMPHTWINLSFYSSKKRIPGYGTFVPRIKVPQEILKVVDRGKGEPVYPTFASSNNLKSSSEEHSFPDSVYDYDAYDAQVFKIPTNQHNRTYRSLQRTPARKKATSQSSSHPPPRVNYQRKLSDPDLYRTVESMTSSLSSKVETVTSLLARSPAINIPSKLTDNKACSHSFGALNIDGLVEKKFSAHSEPFVSKIGSSGANSPNEFHQITLGKLALRPGRSLINPFNPSHVTIKLTSSRRRWIHTFPKGPTGVLIQQHHYQMSSVHLSDDDDSVDPVMGGEMEECRLRSRSSDHRSHDSFNSDEPLTNGHTQNPSRNRTLSANEGWPTIGTSVSSSIASTRGTSSPQKHPLYSQGVQPPPMPGIAHNNATMQINKHATLLWGATGEQEWNAEITTGVDWKSLTLPACLPLTTDYFPDKQSLQYDYEVAANYSRLPESFDNIFLELVSQRLSQGFQLIMRPDEGQSSNQRQNSLMRSRRSKMEEVIREYKLSIGRVFHWLQFKDSSIDVTIYRPKHPYPPLERKYKFRFRSPYLSQYEVNWGEFKTERLENYKWNNLDSYISFKGDQRECKLLEEFKYWRFRLMILPDVFKSETKKLIDAPPNTPCDIYHSLTLEEQQSTIDNFFRFLEVIHRVKRPGNSKKSWGARERVGSVRMTERSRPRPGNKVPDRVRFESGSKDKEECTSRTYNDGEEEFRDEGEIRKLSQSLSLSAIVDAMKDPSLGVSFISAGHTFLPPHTFISYDATTWVSKRIEDIPSQAAAVDFLQKLMDENLIKHASGIPQKPFINGFHLYYFTTEGEKNTIDPSAFEAEWHEITIDPLPCRRHSLNSDFSMQHFESHCAPFQMQEMTHNKPAWTSPDEPPKLNNKGMYRVGYLEIDGSNKSDRFEWGHLKYQTTYSPLQCFEFIIQWMCATGTLVNDLILTWQRKATNQSLHLFPVPTDPFALPFSFHSNPLRSPIVIPLNVDTLRDENDQDTFSEFNPSSIQKRIHLFQESILQKFGFMRYTTETEDELKNSYVHVTGNMMVLISTSEGLRSKPRLSQEKEKQRKVSMTARKTTCASQPCFLWTFNYMLTKRWKSSTSADEAHGERILKDFKKFCANSNHRLRNYWNSFVTLLPDLSQSAQPFVDVCMQ